MKALWLESARTVRYGDLPTPTPPPGWVRLKVLAASVCGSDLKTYKNGRSYQLDKRVSGHEFVGVIDQVADADSPWKPGTRVCAYPQLYCRTCDDCREGSVNLCRLHKLVGGRDYNGGFAEYIVVPEYVLMEVPEGISDVEAAMTEPFAVSLHAVNRAGGEALKGKRLAIYGAGSLGFFALEAAKYYGVAQIIMLSRGMKKLEIAKAHGATDIIQVSGSTEDLREEVLKRTDGRGVDAVVDTACMDVTLNNSLHICKSHGIISVPGMNQAKCTVDFQYLVSRELTITGSNTYTTEMEECLNILASGKVSTAYIADPIVPLCQGVETFQKLADQPEACMKAVFIP